MNGKHLSGHKILLVLIALLVTTMANGASGTGRVWWSPDLHLASLADLPSALAEPVGKEGKRVALS